MIRDEKRRILLTCEINLDCPHSIFDPDTGDFNCFEYGMQKCTPLSPICKTMKKAIDSSRKSYKELDR